MNDLYGLIKQCQRDSERWFPSVDTNNIPFLALCIAGEVGEMCNIIKKIERGSVSLEEVKEHLGEEAVDVLIYLCNLFAALGVDPVEIYKEKRAFNEQRFGTKRGERAGVVDGPVGDLPDPAVYYRSRAA